ncbi:MAG: hypothetical protein K0R58_509, partial [Ramlibacter sp.]|jgi:polysaccharide export outer membrane protein|nr:hypothetical protein [Ramlibacter sp.]
VLQVLSQAGGLDRFADADRITVLRKMGPGAPDETLRVRYGDLLKGRELDSNIVMRPGDTVVVP